MVARLFFLLLAKAIFMALLISYGHIELGPDEAQYWTWSQALDWGYYSKPPGIAWQIFLGTHLFGSTEWAVRCLSILLSAFQSYLVYLSARYAGLSRDSSFWSAICMAFSPIGFAGSLFAVTDVGFLLCWTGASALCLKAISQKSAPSIPILSTWVIVGALFKWPMFLFWLFVALLRKKCFPSLSFSFLATGLLVSCLALLPSFWWNFSHDWATFRHTFATLIGGSGHKAAGNGFEFLGAQALLLSPLLFFLFAFSVVQWFKNRQALPLTLYFCGFVTSATLIAACVASCFQKIQGNWALFAYPTGWILLGWMLEDAKKINTQAIMQKWTKIGIVSSVVLIAIVLGLAHSSSLPFAFQPFKHNSGSRELSKQLDALGYDPDRHFLAADRYQTASLLSFYARGQKRAYFLNLQGQRNNQFSYWPSLEEEQKGKSGFFVWIENGPRLQQQWERKIEFYLAQLGQRFSRVALSGLFPLIEDGEKIGKGALIFQCEDIQPGHEERSALY